MVTFAVLVAGTPATTPGSPLPVSPVVPCQLPSLKPASAFAVSVTSLPGATQAFCGFGASGAPLIETEHQFL